VIGKTIGSTALTIYGPNKQLIASVNVVVSGDLDGLRTNLKDLLPGESDIQIRQANQSIVLSGTVTSPASLQRALALAETYAPTKVVNMLGVEGTQQIMLSVRFVEMQRSVAKDLRINLVSPTGNGNPDFQIFTGPATNGGTNILEGTFGIIAQRFGDGGRDLNLLLDALEEKGLIKTLAEPNLVAMSGDTASFLAGGEFPIPVAQQAAQGGGAPTISIEYKKFGVALGFTPTLLSDGLINLAVAPEVSSIDRNTSVELGIIRVPGIKVRRANTTVELRDGETLTIAGLLKDDYTSQISQFPFLGDLPIIGSLFRSNGFQHEETELVIAVTPHLVTPRRGKVAGPGDNFVPPSDAERFLLGVQENRSNTASGDGHVLQ
jgi:pilus assembly protein CpaC